MNKFLLLLLGLIVLASMVASECKLNEKKHKMMVKKYKKCLDKGYSSKLQCDSSNKKPSKKTKRNCSRMERQLAKCGWGCQYTLRATCDNRMTVYVDGVQKHAENLNDWTKESIFNVSSSYKVIAIKCIDLGGPEGLLASLQNAAGVDVLVTDSSWSCSNVEEPGWMNSNFTETPGNWQPADVIGPHGMSPWKKIGQISEAAKWIWTKNRSPEWSKEPPIFCRHTTSG